MDCSALLGPAENYCETLARPVRLSTQHWQVETGLSQCCCHCHNFAQVAIHRPLTGI